MVLPRDPANFLKEVKKRAMEEGNWDLSEAIQTPGLRDSCLVVQKEPIRLTAFPVIRATQQGQGDEHVVFA